MKPRFRWSRRLAFAIVAIGLVLVAAPLAYFAYSKVAESDLSDLVATAPGASNPLNGGAVDPSSLNGAGTLGGPKQFQRVDWASLAKTLGDTPRATRIEIPVLAISSPVVDVSIVDDGGQRAWQRPKNSVGLHEGSAHPGEAGNTVMSGHVNSPIRGEGSVFKRLPQLPALLRGGQVVEVYVYTETKTFIYQAVATDVLDPDDSRIFGQSGKPLLTIITCVPDLVYSQRLVVSAVLTKVADGGAPGVQQVSEGAVVAPA
ncbi:MAG: sortase [Chloroflexi bacterium]|nr:sortase [Chloroflexota bacterium]